jgi:hypothetical protein
MLTDAERAALDRVEYACEHQGPGIISVERTDLRRLLALARRVGAAATPADAEPLRGASVWLPGEGAWLPLADYAALVRAAATARAALLEGLLGMLYTETVIVDPFPGYIGVPRHTWERFIREATAALAVPAALDGGG